MTNSSRSSVYVNSHIDFLLAINVQSEIIDKNNWLVHLYLAFGIAFLGSLNRDRNAQ